MKIPRPLLIFIGIVWLFAVTFTFYIVHKPFTADSLTGLGDTLAKGILPQSPTWDNVLALVDTLANIIVISAILLLAATLGWRVTRRFEFASPLEAISFRAGLGLGLLSFVTFGLGLLGLLNPILFWLLMLAAAFLGRDDLLASFSEFRDFRLEISSRFERALVAFVAASLIIAFLFALTPPIAWDSQTYHLVEAKHAMEQGRITSPPDIVYFSFPSLGEMLFLAAMILKGDIAAQILHFDYLLLTLGLLFAFANRYFNSPVAWLACAILIAVPSLLSVATNAYVDVMLVFYAFGAFYVLMIAFEKNELRWYAFAGAFAGMAMGVKYTGMFAPLAIFILILIRNGLGSFRSAIVYLLFAAIFASPWYLRNLFFTGNPVYPFLFGGPYWDAFRSEWFSRFGSGLVTTPLKILTAPWDATVFGLEGTESYSATIGPLLLALLPLLLLQTLNSKLKFTPGAPRTTHHELHLTFYVFVFSLILYLVWLAGIAESKLLIQTRLLYPAFPTLALGAAIAFDRLRLLDLVQFSFQRFTQLLIVLVLGLTLLSYALAFVGNNPLAFLTGAVSRNAFLEGRLGGYYRAAEFINTELPRDARLIALWEPRSYYIRQAIQPDVILDLFEHRLSQTRDADIIARGWRDAGYTHVLLYRKGLNQLFTSQYDPVSAEDVRILQALLARSGRLVYGEPLEIESNEIVHAESAPYAIYMLEPK